MLINEMLKECVSRGISLSDARNIVAEEIILSKIASSDLTNHVTLKGGIVMYNLSKNGRRVTKDIDFDLIRYSIDEKSINLFVSKMNAVKDGFRVSIKGKPEELNQEDYKGVRLHLIISDSKKDSINLKLDIGVHTYLAIEQNNMVYSFSLLGKHACLIVNSPEQIVAEKLISLGRLGIASTRYKDLYDIYYLDANNLVNTKKVSNILKMFFSNSKRKPKTITELQNVIEDTLNSPVFASEAARPENKWIDVEYKELQKKIIQFVLEL